MWDVDIGTIIVPTISTMLLFVFTIKFFKYFIGEQHIQIQDSKHHNWKIIKKTSKAFYCSICEALLLHLDGLYCDSCGVCADHSCVKLANKKLKCKEITYNNDDPMKHHWIKGNLPLVSPCSVCNEECESVPGAHLDWWCCWCQRCVHDSCKHKISELCDFGEFQNMIIPPKSLQVVNRRRTMRRRLQLRSILPPLWSDWNPLIVVANKKSGSSDGEEILSWFRRLLNPAQVVDLTERDPVAALEWCRLLGKTPCNILVAGGDGSIAWLLNSIHKLGLEPVPAVAILPLGTGNDLSRVMGWGKELDPDVPPETILRQIRTANRVELDRWNVKISPTGMGLGFRASQNKMFMYNYLSIGVDAQVALNFHKTRESRFYLFSHRIFNKLLYLCFGTHQVVERECKDLDKKIEVYLDGEQIELPSLEGIIVLNIPSWAAGVNVWNMNIEDDEEVGEQSFNDGMLEIIGVHSSFHIAQLSVGLSKPHRLGQAKAVKIKLKETYATQVDGEPWMQAPCEFEIEHCNRAIMLMNTDC